MTDEGKRFVAELGTVHPALAQWAKDELAGGLWTVGDLRRRLRIAAELALPERANG